ncbi:pterin-4-alpha-carbinolamine dehydratase [Sulfolobus sp. A20]|uniref:4a-hydroxytetrahydrobiopterin dehydratase n=1 Tax=Sulfolobaceae TaxID=118883 RepID=UPI0008461492|nr:MULTISPECIES: 4a-hydroxytetrahydrobiopterin dehydratase [unclassified Sulfolobus]TRM76052.1 4a-hydroxytetrahydrobiopterin dehydratase [Sulfolobus sp. E5]TRM77993.1 4a-hydroxytetrahydrobiopterin dehydratase [Sulfolobus sp. A20-N-F8]TRM78043.1 4a-hydroxytetrahydrobiopterin dehydratase [Sulfolobus sp. B5]TRM82353.1 4a-hydroxytetrahydrobiopterin dehydratase [Sulfolobus sp. A20-N-F6]TRM84445.1 4a-hydroxytetrahydrobiopterin dehydratase [Sulfolobus sp. F3]TRM87406.1 4a-hydroxytetrahydrobiopterin 
MREISEGEISQLISAGWNLTEDRKKIKKEFRFKNFKQSIDFMKEIQPIADGLNHHPDVCIYYNKVFIELSTHEKGGLTDLDYQLAVKIDDIYKMLS